MAIAPGDSVADLGVMANGRSRQPCECNAQLIGGDMSFAKWKKASKHYKRSSEASLQAAYKAGMREGTKDAELIATMAIQWREAIDQARCAEEMKKSLSIAHSQQLPQFPRTVRKPCPQP